jgi:hypothetical protein
MTPSEMVEFGYSLKRLVTPSRGISDEKKLFGLQKG